ncbi:MAG TPA: SEC-C metal-binding domain-containing protein [bacterium]|nr:SEC-C metal-binding domain-containing protein [bacterium]HNT66972.1 SEC-C metal-binding domain-containing protein [bacterium]HOX85069.1 SEC-C metal-binding domain-containing protein [bacterium]HPG44066.1 SEC-C metal-binding domain-containing protein [bacterium]HPM96432.1 SEC-C metal-binding domain-containing protein [bacterium]
MSSKIPRNDPCPCGSGKKYKDRRRLRERNGHDFALRPSTRTHQLLRSLD